MTNVRSVFIMSCLGLVVLAAMYACSVIPRSDPLAIWHGLDHVVPLPDIPLPVPRPPIPAETHKPVYHKVLKGGARGPLVDCDRVPLIAHQYPPAVVEHMARNYGLSNEAISQLHACLQGR
jgi:hypothetical protein